MNGLTLAFIESPQSKASYSSANCNENFFGKYKYSRDNFRGIGCSASVYVADKINSDDEISTDLQELRVVKVYDTSDEGNLEAARNEVKILQKLPKHELIV